MGNKCSNDKVDPKALNQAIEENDLETMQVLKNIPVISSLSQKELVKMSNKLQKQSFKKGEHMMKFGEEGDKFYLIISGKTEVQSKEGVKLNVLGAGEYVGEQSLLNAKPRNANIICLQDTETLVMDKKTFDSVLGSQSKAKFKAHGNKRGAVLTAFKLDEDEKGDADDEKRERPDDKRVEWLLGCLKDNLLFQPLTENERRDIAKSFYREKVEKGFELIKQGDLNGQTFYVVEKGNFAIILGDTQVATYKPTWCFGELALMYNSRRAATVKAMDEAVVWTMQQKDFRKRRMQTRQEINKKRVGWIKKVPLFKHLTALELGNIQGAMEEKSYPKDHVLIKQGEQGDRFYVIRSGKLKWSTEAGESGERGIGEYIGERALITNQPRAATVTCIEPCKLLEVGQKDFQELLGSLSTQMKKRIDNEEDVTADFLQRIETQRANKEGRPKRGPTVKKRGSALIKGICKLKDLETIGVLGKGAFGTVTLVVDPRSKKSYALKAIKKSQIAELGQQDHIVNEKDVMLLMDNDFLVNLRGTYKDKYRVYFLLDVCLGGELFTILRKRRYFDEDTSRFYAGCVIEAFDYMHSNDIIYRDLKPENLVLDEKGFLKVTDFGFAKKITDKTYTLCGTPDYLAPEIVTGQGHGKGVDWWTLGILIYEMLASFPPFFDDQAIETYRKIVKGKVKFPRYFTQSAKDIIKAFLKNKPTRRLGVLFNGDVDKIRVHPWFSTFAWKNLKEFKYLPPIIPRIKNAKDLSNFNKMKLEKEANTSIRASQDFDATF